MSGPMAAAFKMGWAQTGHIRVKEEIATKVLTDDKRNSCKA